MKEARNCSLRLLVLGFAWMLADSACWQGVCVCVCMRANARDEHLSLLVLFVTIIYMNDPGAGECLNVYSVIVSLCEDVSRTFFDIVL